MNKVGRKRMKAGTCNTCKRNRRAKVGTFEDGTPRYISICHYCRTLKWGPKKGRYNRDKHEKKHYCERCSFVAIDQCQLDIDHVIPLSEGGKDETKNTQTLCANCHRLKTKEDRLKYSSF